MISPRTLLALALLTIPAVLTAQAQTGRHFQRSSRLPTTPAASAAKDASAPTRQAAPLQKMRSGRAWPRFHFGRLPQSTTGADQQAVDASARKSSASKRGFWHAHG